MALTYSALCRLAAGLQHRYTCIYTLCNHASTLASHADLLTNASDNSGGVANEAGMGSAEVQSLGPAPRAHLPRARFPCPREGCAQFLCITALTHLALHRHWSWTLLGQLCR